MAPRLARCFPGVRPGLLPLQHPQLLQLFPTVLSGVFATPCTSAGILQPFALGEQIFITTLTSARQELQRPRATVLRYLLLLSFSSYPLSHTALLC